MPDIEEIKDRLDLLQQRVPPIAFLVGVWLRYREDRNYEYAALLSYYGFFSLFPLLLVLVTALGWLLSEYDDLRNRILDTVFAQIPVVGTELARNTKAIEGDGITLLVGVLVTLWAGLGVVKVAQDAFNNMWAVSIMHRPGFFPKLLRGLGSLLVIGAGFVVATIVSAVSLGADMPGLAKLGSALLSLVVNTAVLLLTFKVLTASGVGFRTLLPGSLFGGFALWLLQLVGTFYISSVIVGAGAVYGSFATVIGLMVWMALLARVMLLSAEVNVVVDKRLWPRGFEGRNLTEADRRAFEEVAQRDIRIQQASTMRISASTTLSGVEQGHDEGEQPGEHQATDD